MQRSVVGPELGKLSPRVTQAMGGDWGRWRGWCFEPYDCTKEAIDVCGQVAEEVVKGIGYQIN
jgi:hypothetical protein